jgi:DHA1 family bicyclomycin/chloramphenicol resistance-like MFS transporter
MAMLTMVVVAVTTASPYAGGHIISFGGWRGAFWVQGIIAIVFAVACWRLLPETRRREHMSASLPLMLQSGRGLLSRPAFSIYVLQSAVILTIFMVFVSVSPYIMADALHRPGTEFGLYFMLIAGGYFLGNMQVSKRSHSVNADRTTNLGLWLQLVAAVLALIFVAAGLKHPMWMFGPMLPLAFGQGLAMPHLTARAVEMAPGNAGVAASLLGFAQQALAAVSVQLMGWARTDTAVPLLLFCTGASLVALIPVLMKGTPIGSRRPPNTSI